jgi:hypothetical protein
VLDLSLKRLPLVLWAFIVLAVIKLLFGTASGGGALWFAVAILLSVLTVARVRLAHLLLLLFVVVEIYAIWLIQGSGGLSVAQVALIGCGVGQIATLLAPSMRAYLRGGPSGRPNSAET